MGEKKPTQLGQRLQDLFLKGQGVVTQQYGNRNSIERFSGGINYGTDIGVNEGTPIHLPQGNWRVESVYNNARGRGYIGNGENSGYGNSVLARNIDTGEAYRFSHLLKSAVQAGQQLQGGLLGYSGATGNATGPHVDIEYYNKEGRLADPSGVSNVYGGMLRNVAQNTGKMDLKSVFSKARNQYGNGLLGVGTNPEKLKQMAQKFGGKVVRITV